MMLLAGEIHLGSCEKERSVLGTSQVTSVSGSHFGRSCRLGSWYKNVTSFPGLADTKDTSTQLDYEARFQEM
jgi:hypothetical protein